MSRVVGIETSRVKNYIDFRKDPISFFIRMLPQGDIVSLRTGFKPTFIVNSPEFVQEILVAKEASFRKGRTSQVLRRTIGDGLLTTEKEEHRRQKSYYQPVFYKERIKNYADTIVEEAKNIVRSIEDQTICSMHEMMMQLTLTIITKSMFATDVEEIKKELADAVNDTIEQTASALFSPILVPMAIPTKGNRVHKQAITKLEQMVFKVIEEAKQEPERFKMTMLGMLLDTKKADGMPIKDEEIRDQMMTMLLAGHETSANLLTWIFYALGRNPEAESKFYEEISQLDDIETNPYETFRNLEYTELVIKEALRLYPPAWLIYREAEEDVELLGERFNAGSTFMICSYAIHRNEKIFSDPEKFIPERFEGGRADSYPKFAYFPFGGGSRSCIGYKFALMEMVLILAIIGRKFRFRPINEKIATPDPLVSLRIKGGLQMRAEKRS